MHHRDDLGGPSDLVGRKLLLLGRPYEREPQQWRQRILCLLQVGLEEFVGETPFRIPEPISANRRALLFELPLIGFHFLADSPDFVDGLSKTGPFAPDQAVQLCPELGRSEAL
jgi:hypothetical protein